MKTELLSLSNGLPVVVEERKEAHSLTLGFVVDVGVEDETREINGISHFIEHCVFKGTKRSTYKDLLKRIDDTAGAANGFTEREFTGYFIKVPVDTAWEAFKVLKEIVFEPSFPEEEIEKERLVVLNEIRNYEDIPEEVLSDMCYEGVWDGHPLGMPILGREETVKGLKRGDLVSFWEKTYRAKNLVFGIAGRIDEALLEKMCRELEDISPGESLFGSPQPLRFNSVRKSTKKDCQQAYICVAVEAVSSKDEDRHKWAILNTILGAGMSSRLPVKIREEKGLAYSIYSSLSLHRAGGIMMTTAVTSPENTTEVLSLIKACFEDLVSGKEPVSKKEFERAKRLVLGALKIGFENTYSCWSRITKSYLTYGRPITVEELLEKYSSISYEEFMEFLRKVEKRLGKYSEFFVLPQA